MFAYLNGKKYHVEPILNLVQKEKLSLKEKSLKWGYNTSCMLTGLKNKYSRTAIAAAKNNDTDFSEEFKVLSY